jgi:2-phosphoglycerate kinase
MLLIYFVPALLGKKKLIKQNKRKTQVGEREMHRERERERDRERERERVTEPLP